MDKILIILCHPLSLLYIGYDDTLFTTLMIMLIMQWLCFTAAAAIYNVADNDNDDGEHNFK